MVDFRLPAGIGLCAVPLIDVGEAHEHIGAFVGEAFTASREGVNPSPTSIPGGDKPLPYVDSGRGHAPPLWRYRL